MHSSFYSLFKQSLQTSIDSQYSKLKLSMYSILEIVSKQYEFKGIYNPKDNSTEVVDKEFDEFQLMLRNYDSYIYYNSLILIGFSSLESSLKQICDFIEKRLENSEVFEIARNKNIFNQYVIYFLNHVSIIEKRDFNKIKGEIERVNKLRNLIVHNNSNLIRKKNILLEKQDNFKILSECKYLTLMDTGQVFINNPEYIKSFILNSKKLLDIMIRSLLPN